jgi:MATE family multidrug resistance protein
MVKGGLARRTFAAMQATPPDPPTPEPAGEFRREVRALTRLAAPIVLTQLSMMALGFVDLAMVGKVGEGAVEAVAAVSLGNMWKVGTGMVAMGIVLGIDPFVTQAHGARDAVGLARALQRGIVVALLVSLPVALLWLFTGRALVAFDQDPQIAAVAHDYVLVQLPSQPFFLVFCALRQYLQGRGILRPMLFVALAANALNVLLNWMLVFGNLGAPALGAVGSGVATSIVQMLMPVALFVVLRLGKLHEGAWAPWSREALDPQALRAIFAVGVPIGVHFAAEIWGFQIAMLWSGWLGATELAANALVLNLASLSFMMPLGVALAAVTRVGNLIGEKRPREAQTAAWGALALGVGVMALCGLAFYVFRGSIGRLYTDDAAVLALVATCMPVAAAFQVFDGAQVVASGILRGMGNTRPSAIANVVGYYVLGLPLGYWLTFELGFGLPGLWWGVALGVAAVAVGLVAWIALRGPARVKGPLAPRTGGV